MKAHRSRRPLLVFQGLVFLGQERHLSFKEPKRPVGFVAELFAGVGGFRIGLAKAGWKTVYSNQWEPSTKRQHASEVYVHHFGPEGHSNADVASVERIPSNFDLLVGGFPCQDYSVAKSLKSATGLEGKKGVLWWEILRLVIEHKPKFLLLENVDRLLGSPSARPGRDFSVMLASLGRQGYLVEWRVINAADYGFPQRRKRVFIVAKRDFEEVTSPQQYLVRDGILARSFPVQAMSEEPKPVEIGCDPVVSSEGFNSAGRRSPFQNAGVFIGGVAFTGKVTSRFSGRKLVLDDILVSGDQVPDDFWLDEHRVEEWKYLKGAKSIPRVQKDSGYTYNYSEGPMSFPDPINLPSRTILTGEGGSSPSRFKHVVRTEGRLRRLTPIELERLSGFPDNWTNPEDMSLQVTEGRRAFFIGNALVVGLVERIGKVLAKEAIHLEKK